jgi:Glutamine amidotransferase class-I
MGLSHRLYPLHGVQFHPESFLTAYGWELAANFLSLAPGFQLQGKGQREQGQGKDKAARGEVVRWPGNHFLFEKPKTENREPETNYVGTHY